MQPQLPMALPMAGVAKTDQVRRVERKFFHPHGRRAGCLDRHDVVYLSGYTDQAAFRTVTAQPAIAGDHRGADLMPSGRVKKLSVSFAWSHGCCLLRICLYLTS